MLSRDKEGPRTRIVRFQSTKVVPTSTIIVNYLHATFPNQHDNQSANALVVSSQKCRRSACKIPRLSTLCPVILVVRTVREKI